MSESKSKKRGIARYNEIIGTVQPEYDKKNGPVKKIDIDSYLKEKRKSKE